MLVGAAFVSERHMLSRVVSAATLFILGVIALRFGYSVISDAYLLVIAFGIALLGAQPTLHRKPASRKRTIVYGTVTACVALGIAMVFVYGAMVVERIILR